MLGLGLIFLIIAAFCMFKYCQHKKYLDQNQEEQLVDPMLMQTNEDELRDFSGEQPNVSPNERPFHLGGKPIASDGMLDAQVNQTYNGTGTKGSRSERSKDLDY